MGRGRTRCWVAGGLAATLLAGCGSTAAYVVPSGPSPTPPVPGLTTPPVAPRRLPAPTDAPVAATVAGLNAFAAHLAAKAAQPGQNLVLSPLSIAYAFAMLDAGAGGNTAAQIEKALGLPAGYGPAFNALTSALVTTDTAPATSAPQPTPGQPPAEPIVALTDGLFAQSGYTYEPAFLQTLIQQFGSQVQTLDFTNPAAALAAIDRWAADHTAGRITKVFDQLDPTTRLVLANAIYLRASWTTPFSDARDQNFRVGSSTVQVPMIDEESNFGYAVGAGWRAVTLPYAGNRLAVRVIVPTGSVDPTTLLTSTVLAAASVTKPTEVNVTMPAWRFDSSPDLQTLMKELGVSDCFDPTRADLKGISTKPLYIGQAVHKATISVDRYGTEAAAVTALAGLSAGLAAPPVDFTVDRPFVFEIVDTTTSAPLFLGTVADPRAH